MNHDVTLKKHTYVMPAEWRRHRRTWMSWPSNRSLWGDFFEGSLLAYSQVISAISRFEPVSLLVRQPQLAEAQAYCVGRNVTYVVTDMDDSWLRDSGPTFVKDQTGCIHAIGWSFNAYGEKYPFANDRNLSSAVARAAGVPYSRVGLVTEGGAISTDGAGTIICTKSSILEPRRNPGISSHEVEAVFTKYLGASKVIWLESGLQDDDTDGHVDEVACFVKPGVILALSCSNRNDPDYAMLADNYDRLRHATNASGRTFEVETVHAPTPVVIGNRRLSMSYVNFYFANGALILPQFGDSHRDAVAVELFTTLFPDRAIVPVNTQAISRGGGNIHCITQQEPE